MDARTVANYMVYIMSDAFDDLTNMKINKLLYMAQGHYLAKYGKPLFDDRIEAWDHGPVVPSVYYSYKRLGDRSIKEYNPDIVDQITPEAEEILYGVARKYGGYTASYLRKMTHAVGTPWDQVYHRGCADVKTEGDELVISADCFAKGVWIRNGNDDMRLEDNYFDLNGETRRIKITEGKPENITVSSVYDIR